MGNMNFSKLGIFRGLAQYSTPNKIQNPLKSIHCPHLKSKMKKLKYLFILLFGAASQISASPVNVSAKIDSSTLLIGEQRVIHIQAEYPKLVDLNFPDIPQDKKLAEGIEILRKTEKDTTELKGSCIRISQDLIVTSFDTGRYEIPAFRFTSSDRNYETDKIIVDVVTIEEDFTKCEITGNNDIYRPSFNVKRLLQYISLALILAGIVYIVILIILLQKRKASSDLVFDNTDKRSPQEIALSALNEIKEEKICDNGEEKKYHTQITDTLRHYFSDRFSISAMEMTSDEMMDELKYHEDADKVEDKIKQVFKLSDMVKFAKYQPTKEENELSIVNALFIVQQTAEEEKPSEESENTGIDFQENNEKPNFSLTKKD